jgi:hypothetical protein
MRQIRESRLICAKCKATGKRPPATLLRLELKPRHTID